MVASAEGDGGVAAAGFFGSITGVVKDLTIDKATVTSTHYAGGICGFSSANVGMKIENCKVTNSSVVFNVELVGENAYDNGDKVGGIIGYMVKGDVIDGCTVENTTVHGYRDIGGIAGYSEGTVQNCATVGVTLSRDTTEAHNYKNYTEEKQFDCNPIVGDYVGATLIGNKVNGTGYEITVTPGTVEELKAAIAAAQGGTNAVITLDQDFDVESNWEGFDLGAYNGVYDITINGNGHTISNLNQPLITGAFAGEGVITINDLTIDSANIIGEGYNNLGLGAFIAYSDASGGVVFNNCKLTNSTITCSDGEANTNNYAGGFIGYVSATTGSTAKAEFNNCTVEKSNISGEKSAGALIGHGGAAVTVNGATVEGCTISEILSGRTDAGAATIAGRMSGSFALTLKGTITTKGNTINQGTAVTGAAPNIYTALGTPVTTEATLVTE